jgi:hypothetical protein
MSMTVRVNPKCIRRSTLGATLVMLRTPNQNSSSSVFCSAFSIKRLLEGKLMCHELDVACQVYLTRTVSPQRTELRDTGSPSISTTVKSSNLRSKLTLRLVLVSLELYAFCCKLLCLHRRQVLTTTEYLPVD